MLYLVYTVHVIICLFLILVVLLQQGSGADLSVFGGGGTQTAFGARSATNLLHKLTVAGFVGFILTTIAFGFLKSGRTTASVMSDVEQTSAADDQAQPIDDEMDSVAAEAGDETESGSDAAGQDATEPGTADEP